MTKTTRASTRLSTAKTTKTLIGKESKSATKKEAVTKTVAAKKTAKKDPVAPKVTATVTKETKGAPKATKGSSNILELCLLLDCTGSMGSWIQRSKDTLKEIIKSV